MSKQNIASLFELLPCMNKH